MDLEFKRKQSVITKYNIDPSTKQPISIPVTEKQQVHTLKNLIQMVGEPSKNKKIQIVDRTMVAVDRPEKMTQPYHYYADYDQGIIHFHPDMAGQEIEFKYDDIGVTLISANKVFTKQDAKGNVVELLEDIIESGREAIDVMKTIGGVAIVMKRLEDDIEEGYAVSQKIQDDIQQAKDEVIDVSGNKEILVLSTEWTLSAGIYEKEITHNLNSENLHISFRNADTKEGVAISYKIIDKTRILLKSDKAINLSCVLSASYYHATQTVSDDIATEVVKARKGEKTLYDKINSIDRKLYYKSKEQDLISRFQNKLIKNEGVSIGLYGDSETYGYDITSEDRRQNSVTDNAGNVYNVTIASKTYPEAFKEIMDKVYGVGKVTVKVRAIGGDYVSKALERWIPKKYPIGTDVCIMNYGVNDSRFASCPYAGNTDEFLKYYRELIETELDNGTGIILMTPFKMRTTDVKVQIFETAVINLAKEYGIPVIIGDEMSANLSYSYYSDGTHFNGKGYEVVGVRVANCFVGNGIFNPTVVSENTQLLTRRQLDGIWWNPNDTGISNLSVASYPTPDEGGDKAGIATRIGVGSTVYYTFYAEKDLWIAPYLGFNDEKSECLVELNFGIDTPDYTFDNYPMIGATVDYVNRSYSSVTYTRDMPKISSRIHVGSILVDELPCLRTVTKGWHTISITAKNESMGLGGLVFLDINYFETIRNRYTKFKNNVDIEPDDKTNFRSLNIKRYSSDGKKRKIQIGSHIKYNTPGAGIVVLDEDTNDVVCEAYFNENGNIFSNTMTIVPKDLTNGVAYATERIREDEGKKPYHYRTNYGLFYFAGELAAGLSIYDLDNNGVELNRVMLTPDCLSTMKNGVTDLGKPAYKFKDIYSSNGVIQTSDRREKKDIKDIKLGLDFINKLRPVDFKFINNTSNRVHCGLIAQELEEVLEEDRAILIHSNEIDEETGEKKDSYSLRYNELIAPMIKAIQELTQEVNTLKEELKNKG